MLELYEFFINNRNKPLEYIVLAALLFIADRLGRKFITSQVKRLFRVEDRSDFYHYVQNQRRIESKLDAIMQKEGITWHAHTFTQDSLNIAKKRKRLLLPLSAVLSLAQDAKQYINWRLKRMSNINKGILLPLLAAIASFLKSSFGYELSDQEIDNYADMILGLLMILGMFMNFTKKKKTPKQKETSNDDFTTPIEPRV